MSTGDPICPICGNYMALHRKPCRTKENEFETFWENGEWKPHPKLYDFQKMNDVIESAKKLLEKMDKVHNSKEYDSVFSLAWAHGMEYSGENYKEEMDDLKKKLEEFDG